MPEIFPVERLENVCAINTPTGISVLTNLVLIVVLVLESKGLTVSTACYWFSSGGGVDLLCKTISYTMAACDKYLT